VLGGNMTPQMQASLEMERPEVGFPDRPGIVETAIV